jgi:hypothetical protein
MRIRFVRKSMTLHSPYDAALHMYISQKLNYISPALLMRFLICSNEEKKIMLIRAERPTLTPRPVNWSAGALE